MHFQLHAVLTTSACILLLNTIEHVHILSKRAHNSQQKHFAD